MEISIIFEDNDIIVVEKPYGLLSQGSESESESVLSILEKQLGLSPYLIHRLDRNVGGLMVLAKNADSAARLDRAVSERAFEKQYMAICCGEVRGSGCLTDYLMKNQRLNLSKIVNSGNVGAKKAVLEYEAFEYVEPYTLVKIRLLTGRHHQIRAQMAHFGAPLLNDSKYNPLFRHKRCNNIGLWSYHLSFYHPKTNERLFFTRNPASEDFKIFEYFRG